MANNNSAGIFLNLDTDPDKYLIVYQRYYPGEKSSRYSKSFRSLLSDILVGLKGINSIHTVEFEKYLNMLNSSKLRNSGKDIETDYTNVIIKPILMHLQDRGVDINFICETFGFSYVISIPKGSPDEHEGPMATALREFKEEIGIELNEDLKAKNVKIHKIQKGNKMSFVYELSSSKMPESDSNLKNLPIKSEREVVKLFIDNIDYLMEFMKQIPERIRKGNSKNNKFSSPTKRNFEIIYKGYFSLRELDENYKKCNPLVRELLLIKKKENSISKSSFQSNSRSYSDLKRNRRPGRSLSNLLRNQKSRSQIRGKNSIKSIKSKKSKNPIKSKKSIKSKTLIKSQKNKERKKRNSKKSQKVRKYKKKNY